MAADRIQIRKAQFGHTLTQAITQLGLSTLEDLEDELQYYTDVLMGRKEAPLESPYLALQEVATAYHSRAREIEMLIYNGERAGDIKKYSPYQKFRTGTLNSFIELSKRAAELGSRRLTQESLLWQARLER